MVSDLNESKLETIKQIREFLAGTSDIAFSIPTDSSPAWHPPAQSMMTDPLWAPAGIAVLRLQ